RTRPRQWRLHRALRGGRGGGTGGRRRQRGAEAHLREGGAHRRGEPLRRLRRPLRSEDRRRLPAPAPRRAALRLRGGIGGADRGGRPPRRGAAGPLEGGSAHAPEFLTPSGGSQYAPADSTKAARARAAFAGYRMSGRLGELLVREN